MSGHTPPPTMATAEHRKVEPPYRADAPNVVVIVLGVGPGRRLPHRRLRAPVDMDAELERILRHQ